MHTSAVITVQCSYSTVTVQLHTYSSCTTLYTYTLDSDVVQTAKV